MISTFGSLAARPPSRYGLNGGEGSRSADHPGSAWRREVVAGWTIEGEVSFDLELVVDMHQLTRR